MTIVEIMAYGNNGHRNQTGNFKVVPDGWAVVPEGLDTPNFPFGNIVVSEIDGVWTVTEWTACPCPEPEETPKTVNSIDLSSYYAFCANVNETSIDCAFGKNNEDRILNLGLQLAMYSWFCGDSKTDYPFTELCKCCKLTDIETNNAGFKELWENNTLRRLYIGGSIATSDSSRRQFPSNRVMQRKKVGAGTDSQTVPITEEDIICGYLWWDIKGALKSGESQEYYLNDVLIRKWTESFADGIVIKLSDYGINSPGDYKIRRANVTSSSPDWNLYCTTE